MNKTFKNQLFCAAIIMLASIAVIDIAGAAELPDLTITSLSAPTNGNTSTIDVTATIKNLGGNTGSIYVGYYLSADNTITTSDTYLANSYIGGMASGAETTVTKTITVPNNLNGNYYIGAIADYPNWISEINETNNSLAAPLFSPVYNFLGIKPPINSDGSSIFKLGSTVPVKFNLSDANGNDVSTAVANLTYQLISNEILGTIEESVSTSAANDGNTFRYDTEEKQYIFNLGTDNMSSGTYQLNINLDDGTIHTVNISLRNEA